MPETPIFFPGGSSELFGVFHEATQPAAGTPFVFCHPFGEEKLWAHRVFVSFARELARRGHTVLRFDYAGNGDSPGDFSQSSVETNLSDISFAIEVIKERTGAGEVSLLGLRFGAALAAQIADRRFDIRQLVLWAPIVSGDRYMQELLRINLSTQMAVFKEIRNDRVALVESMRKGQVANVDGYGVSLAMYEQTSALKLAETSRVFAGQCLIAQIDRAANARPLPESQLLQSRYSSASLALVQEDPFWKEIERFYDRAPHLFAQTLQWLQTVQSSR